jgi:hypothetical protein
MEDVRLKPRNRNSISHLSHAMEILPEEENPADHLSRRLLGDQIQSFDIWWHGSSRLWKHRDYWPSDTFATNKSPPARRKRGPSHVMTAKKSITLVDASKFSSYWKLVRTTAWVFRFLQNVRGKEKSAGELTTTELAAARMHMVRVLQRETFTSELGSLQKNSALPSNSKIARNNPFLEDGLIRLGGSL